MANTKISALTANTNPTWLEELVYAYNNANGKMTLNTMKAFVGWAGITTLNADANIWELTAGVYETAYDLYYKSWEAVRATSWSWFTKKQMLFVTEETSWNKWFFVYNAGHYDSTHNYAYASYWYSVSSTEWACYELWVKDWVLKAYDPYTASSIQSFLKADSLTQIVDDISDWTNELRISSTYPPYPWVTYTVYINSVAAWKSYTITLGTWITNPLWITLPSSSTKKCIITVLITSTTTGIVTGCTIEP